MGIIEFIPDQASEEIWNAYFIHSEAIFREFNKRDRLPDRQVARKMISTLNPLYAIKRWVHLDEGKKAIAYARMSYETESSPDYESNKHLSYVYISVIHEYRRKKIGTKFMKHLIEQASTMGIEIFQTEVDNTPGLSFCKYLRGAVAHHYTQHRLYLADIAWQLAERWLEKGRIKYPLVSIEYFQKCPEKDIEEFSTVYTEIINQRPVGEMEQKLITTPESRRIEERNLEKRGFEWYTMISRDQYGRISGVTDIMYNPEEPHRIIQYLTGVREKYRRMGLAKRLKAEMLFFIKKRFPEVEYITTNTAEKNLPMRSINKRLGFLPKKHYYVFKWDLAGLKQRVDSIVQGFNCS